MGAAKTAKLNDGKIHVRHGPREPVSTLYDNQIWHQNPENQQNVGRGRGVGEAGNNRGRGNARGRGMGGQGFPGGRGHGHNN